MHLVIASGMSGAGKTQALHTLEDQGYYCIDNLPLELFDAAFQSERLLKHKKVAIGIDIRSGNKYLKKLPQMLSKLQDTFKTDVIYLYAGKSVLIKRYDETRRKHPLTDSKTTLREAIIKEYDLLEPIREIADIQIDTSNTNIYELATLIKTRVCANQEHSLSLMFQSFGFQIRHPDGIQTICSMLDVYLIRTGFLNYVSILGWKKKSSTGYQNKDSLRKWNRT